MKIIISEKVRSHKYNPEFKCLVIQFNPYDSNMMIHRTAQGRIYQVDYMPRIPEMIEIIKNYMEISPEFKTEMEDLIK